MYKVEVFISQSNVNIFIIILKEKKTSEVFEIVCVTSDGRRLSPKCSGGVRAEPNHWLRVRAAPRPLKAESDEPICFPLRKIKSTKFKISSFDALNFGLII